MLALDAAGANRLPSYRLNAGALGVGCSLGNSALWVNTKNTGDVERVFSVPAGRSLISAISIRYGIAGRPLRDAWKGAAGDSSAKAYTPLSINRNAVMVEIHPAYQRRTFDIGGSLHVRETLFVPLLGSDGAENDPPVLYQTIEMENRGPLEQDLRINGFARLRGETADDVSAVYDKDLHGLVATNASDQRAVRIFTLNREPSAYETSFDLGNVYSVSRINPLANTTDAVGDILGSLQVEFTLQPGGRQHFSFVTGLYANGVDDAKQRFEQTSSDAQALEQTIVNLEDVLHRGEVITPDAVINDGAIWSKVNMRRVMAKYPTGWLFTNDPGVMSNVVCRDCAWFVYGCDHFMPSFSRSLLDKWASVQYPNGKLPEYIDALTDRCEDDGLNINDDTPLYIMAANHHFRSTGDDAWLRRIYPSLARAGRYIISQMDARDLVVCTAQDPRGNVWAIAGWRNIIPNVSINGAVTEINAECVAALRELARLGERVDADDEHIATFQSASDRIRAAMQLHLINAQNGLFYLNIDMDGNPHTDVTGDELFPVMFEACDDETGFRIISRLNSSDFWTAAGLRTASCIDPRYDPAASSGLVGGVWPGLTWWYAFAAARYHPEFMVDALRASFEHYAADPRRHNTVPGQFSEWFDGDSLVNRGMRLSPWEPPRFLWAAIEGVCGLILTGERPQINPLVPPNWKWTALRRLPYRGREISYFAVRTQGAFHLFSTCDVETKSVHSIYEQDVSDRIPIFSRTARVIAFQRERELAVLVGNVGTATTNVPLDLTELLEPHVRYRSRVYNSERDDWETDSVLSREQICTISVTIESQGYRVLLFQALEDEFQTPATPETPKTDPSTP
ncbi:MAG: hypothetical protein M3R35_04205 [Candidatus Eremiobacteraeota bacterium]|nr:hypothetical protein [Candidatus Eremiobacteraeota bacterium]